MTQNFAIFATPINTFCHWLWADSRWRARHWQVTWDPGGWGWAQEAVACQWLHKPSPLCPSYATPRPPIHCIAWARNWQPPVKMGGASGAPSTSASWPGRTLAAHQDKPPPDHSDHHPCLWWSSWSGMSNIIAQISYLAFSHHLANIVYRWYQAIIMIFYTIFWKDENAEKMVKKVKKGRQKSFVFLVK